MEDQRVLKAFINDSVQETKDCISKDLADFRYMLLEILGKKAGTSFEPRNTNMDVELWQFQGENPEAWIVQAENYFDFYRIEEDQKLDVGSFYLDGEALKWYQWLFRNNQLIDWPHFVDKLRIRFKQKEYDFVEGRFPNLGQVTYVTEYQNEDILSSFNESNVLSPGYAYVHPQWSNITHSILTQYHGEKTECKSNTSACKVFDGLSDRYKDANPFSTGKPIELPIPLNDLVNSISPIVVVNGCSDDAKSGDKDDEEGIITIRDEPVEFVFANRDKPSLWITSTISISCYLALFDIHKVLDNCWNQLFVGHFEKVFPLELAQCWEKMPSIPCICSFAKLINRGITDHLHGCSHVALIFTLHLFPPDQFGLEFPFDLCSNLHTMFFRVTRNLVFCFAPDKFTMSTLWNSCNWCDTGQDETQLIFGDGCRKYICSFKSNYNEHNLSNFTINCSSLFNDLRRDCLQFATRHAEELRPSMHAENKARYVDMRTLETCLFKVNVFASLGTLLLWKDNSGLTPVARYLYHFLPASIILILAYFHHCKSEWLDTTKPLISRSAFLISSQLVFLVGLGERNCTTYFFQAVVVLTIGVGSFDSGAGNDMPIRNSTDEKILVPLIDVWMAGTCSLVIHWYTALLPFHEETLSANLVLSTTLRICYLENLHKAFVLMHSLRSWIKHLTMIFNQCSRLENTTEHMWLHLCYGVVITLFFNGIDAKKVVSHYESDIHLLLSLLYLNLEDKVLIEEGSIVVNLDSPEAGQAVGPQRGPIIRQPNNRIAWDPG